MVKVCLVFVIAFPMGSALWAAEVKLSERYPGSPELLSTTKGYEWTCTQDDIWRLSNFTFSLDDRFRIHCGPAQVAFGRYENTVLWAAIFPEANGTVERASVGEGDRFTSVWMRFRPERLDEIFPPPTIAGQGDRATVGDANRVACARMNFGACIDELPSMVSEFECCISLEMLEGPPHMFSFVSEKQTILYFESTEMERLAVPQPIDSKTATDLFERVWTHFDQKYPRFSLRPEVDWAELRGKYIKQAAYSGTDLRLADVLSEILSELKDSDVRVSAGGKSVPCFNRRLARNSNRKAVGGLFGPMTVTKMGAPAWCVSDDQIGYLSIPAVSHSSVPEAVQDIVLKKMKGVRGIIVDLRASTGWREACALEIAQVFLDKEHAFAKMQARNGPRHVDLDVPKDLMCGSPGPARYLGPIVVLQGERTTGTAESLLAMLSRAPHVTTMGQQTSGTGYQSVLFNAGAEIRVMVPVEYRLDFDERPLSLVGLAPDIPVKTVASDFADDKDAILQLALERLRAGGKKGD